MGVRVFRGFDLRSGLPGVLRLALVYAGVFAVLWALGLAVRGWRGWFLVIAPLAMLVGARLWSWRRVSVEIAGQMLRYEGVEPGRDFEVPLEAVTGTYRDEMLRGRPLVLVLDSGDERVLEDLDPARAEALCDCLAHRGIAPIAPAGSALARASEQLSPARPAGSSGP